MESLN